MVVPRRVMSSRSAFRRPSTMVSSSDTSHEMQQTDCDTGCNFFDTAEVYANGQSEIEMG